MGDASFRWSVHYSMECQLSTEEGKEDGQQLYMQLCGFYALTERGEFLRIRGRI